MRLPSISGERRPLKGRARWGRDRAPRRVRRTRWAGEGPPASRGRMRPAATFPVRCAPRRDRPCRVGPASRDVDRSGPNPEAAARTSPPSRRLRILPRRCPRTRSAPGSPRRRGPPRQRYRQRAVAVAEPQLEGLPWTVKCATKGQPQVSWFVLHEVPNGSSFHPNHRPAEPAACGDGRRSDMPAGELSPSVSEAAPTPMGSLRGPRTDREGMSQKNWCSITARTPVLLPGRPGPCSASATDH